MTAPEMSPLFFRRWGETAAILQQHVEKSNLCTERALSGAVYVTTTNKLLLLLEGG